jgi:ABC-type oligopeptide transport system substrate-binding subunit
MKPEHQRIKIAEACGWKPNTPDAKTYLRQWLSGRNTGANLYVLPDYLNDLNAMHEAEKILDRSQQNAYINILDGMPDDSCPVHHDFQWCCATAPQRAKAFLKTLGLWEEKS